eukprot:9496305-Pyramimonas_sp.AAC.1
MGRRRPAGCATATLNGAPYGATKRMRGVPKWCGAAMRAAPLGPSVELPMCPRSVCGATKRVMGITKWGGAEIGDDDDDDRDDDDDNDDDGDGQREDGEDERRGEEDRGATSLQTDDPTPQDGWGKHVMQCPWSVSDT